MRKISTEIIEAEKDRMFSIAADSQKRLPGCSYLDLRLGVSDSKYALAQSGASKESREETLMSLSVRVIAGDGEMKAPGYFAAYLGASDVATLDGVVKSAIEQAWKRASANASMKARAKSALRELGSSLYSTSLMPVEIHRDTVVFPCKQSPSDSPLGVITHEAASVSESLEKLCGAGGFNMVSIYTALSRELFVSSEGALIDQTYPLTEGFVYVVVGDEANYDHIGGRCGIEGLYGENHLAKTFRDFALDLGRETLELSKAQMLPATDREVVVVSDPHYNSLLAHEIIGHPCEADRALKTETAYAGRSWLFRSFSKNQIGRKVASDLVSAYSDTSLPGYGFYKYDAEGVKGRRVTHIERGVFRGFLNSRESAAILGEEPNGAMQTTHTYFVPLVRMTNTVFAPGETNAEDIIREVDDGYYLAGHHTPSIGESRENFSISARRVYRIKNGELQTLYRSGGMMSDSRDYLLNVDAVGSDFRLLPMPNCGKGVPMQALRVGNGAPTMRSRARLTGAR
ncbi:MAG: TldD/PmbA family protein [Deltaproteobacteria bacterium]